MNSIRTAIPNQQAVTARRRATRLAQAATLFAAVLVGAISCTDSSVTEPFVPTNPLAGLAASYDSTAPADIKVFGQAPAASIAPLFSASASAASAAGSVSASPVQFAPERGPFAHVLPPCDDCYYGGTSGFPIGFTFRYFGTAYNAFWVSTNGFITLTRMPSSVQWAGCCEGRVIPAADAINNVIALAWGDLDTRGVTNGLSFETRGTAPKRRLIINFAGVKNLNEGGKPVTAQLILYEESNNVEIHTTTSTSMNFRHTQGVENNTGTEAAFIPGRVAARYSLTNDAVRFSGGNNVPVAIPGGNAGTVPNRYEGVEGAAIHFKGSGADIDNDQLTFSWDFNGDGVADAEGAQADRSWPDNGTYRATLFVNDGRGGIGQASVDVVVKNANPVVDAGSDARIIAGQTVNFSGQFSDAGVDDAPWGWTWNVGSLANYSGTTSEQSAAVLSSHRFCKAGSFTAQFTVVDKDGGSGSDAVDVVVEPQSIQIDINPNMIVLNDNGNAMVTVRVYSRADFDATTLNPNAAKLTNGKGRGTSLARTAGGLWQWRTDSDLNGDGLLDVVAQFRRDELLANGDLEIATTQLMLKGEVGDCGEVLGSGPVKVKVQGKPASAGSALQ